MKHLLYLFIILISCLKATAQTFTNTTLEGFTSLVSMEPEKAEAKLKTFSYKYTYAFKGLDNNYREYNKSFDRYKFDLVTLRNTGNSIDYVRIIMRRNAESFPDAIRKSIAAKGFSLQDEQQNGSSLSYYGGKGLTLVLEVDEDKTTLHIYKKGLSICTPTSIDFEKLVKAVAWETKRVDDEGFETYIFFDELEKLNCLDSGFIAFGKNKSQSSAYLQLFFNLYKTALNAYFPGFNLDGDNILFYAVRSTFRFFLNYLYEVHEVDPNIVLHYRGKPATILDFAEQEVLLVKTEIPKNEKRIKEIQDIVDLIRKAGGKLYKDL